MDPTPDTQRGRFFEAKTILIIGTSRPFEPAAARAARMAAVTICDLGFCLIAGNSLGVDKAAGAAFCGELAARGEPPETRYRQLVVNRLLNRELWPGRSFPAPAGTAIRVSSRDEWKARVVAAADAAVILGGRGGTSAVVHRFIEGGKPVFPVPCLGGRSDDLFQSVLRDWHVAPVPGVTQTQFLQLAQPWVANTGALGDLLLGTLADSADIFISYRRADADWVAGRLRDDLAERFGTRRVFTDVTHIPPGQTWRDVIDRAIDRCRAGVVIVGPRWFEPSTSEAQPRLHEEADVVRHEVRRLLESRKPVFLVTTGDAPPVEKWRLPKDLERLRSIQSVTVRDAAWGSALQQLIDALVPPLRPSAGAGKSTKPGASNGEGVHGQSLHG